MAETVKIPGVGPVKKGWAIGGLAILLGILGYAYYRHSKANAAAPAGAASGTAAFNAGFGGTDPFPPDGTVGDPTDPNSTDPNTGLTYGDEQGGGNFPGIFSGGGGGGSNGSTSFATNAQWDQAATAYLTGIGSNPATVTDALGKYLHGDTVTPSQQVVIESAIGAEGNPPVSGAGGFPPNIRVRHPGPPPPPPAKVRVPDVLGDTYQRAAQTIRAAGLKPKQNGPGVIVQERPAAGQEVKRGSEVVLFGRNK